jgi:hypothetical protein
LVFSSQRLPGAALTRGAQPATRHAPSCPPAVASAPAAPRFPRNRRTASSSTAAVARAAHRCVESLEQRVFLSAALPNQPAMGINVDAVTDFNTA